MNDITYRKLNSTESIIEALPKIQEAFITFYGEEERENIQEKFENMLPIGYCKLDALKGFIRNDKKQKSKELVEKLMNNSNVPENEREQFRMNFFDNNELEYQSLHPVYYYIQYLNEKRDGIQKEKAVKFLNSIHDKEVTTENIDELIKNGEFKQYESIIKEYKEALEEYQEYLKEFKPYEDYFEKCQDLKRQLEKKYTMQLIEQFKYLFTPDEYNQIQEKINSKYGGSLKNTNKKTENLLGVFGLNSEALIDSFSEENEQLLESGTDWKKEYIINDRIKYFKNLGIDLGDDYQSYLNHPKLQKVFPGLKKLAEKVIYQRKELYTKMQNEYYQSLPEFAQNIERIEKMELLDKEYGYNASMYERNATFISTNVKKTENGYISYPILCLSVGGVTEYIDHCLIHELNHIYELHLDKVENGKYHMLCGWDIVGGEIYNQEQKEVSLEERKEMRNYELFNEIINELIAQEITEILFNSNGYVFNNQENAKIKYGTSYERSLFLVRKFYDTYKKEIIESRKNGNIQIIYDAVGKENFNALNGLFDIYFKEFSGTQIYQFYQSLEKGEETEKTKIYKELKQERDKILSPMQEFYQTKTVSR